MGFLDKVKNMFTEEVEETPIKKDVIQVDIPAPVVPEKQEQEIAESKAIVKEEKPTAPVFFDDNDFANLEPKEKREEKKIVKFEEKYKEREEKKVFKPTPIISPVYGVLDKNYHKEDITSKPKKTSSYTYENESINIDDVRKKAFGTLEDDLETVMPSDNYEIIEEKGILEEEDTTPEILEDFMDPDYKPRFAEKEVVDEIEDSIDMFDEMREEKELDEDLTESDLFNLIDSMYEKKDDE